MNNNRPRAFFFHNFERETANQVSLALCYSVAARMLNRTSGIDGYAKRSLMMIHTTTKDRFH